MTPEEVFLWVLTVAASLSVLALAALFILLVVGLWKVIK